MPLLPFLTEQFPGGPNVPGDGGPVTDQDDPNFHPEDSLSAPWCIDPVSSWLSYNCGLEVLLDPGTVLLKILPQNSANVDTLGVIDITSEAFAANTKGVNLNSNSLSSDVIQQMATSTYTFVLRGEAYRAGYQVPIPNLVSVAGVACVPTFPHRAVNVISGNLMGGIPLWYAAWELHYLVATCPHDLKPVIAPQNPAAAISPRAELPSRIGVPQAPTDQRAVLTQPVTTTNFVRSPS